MTNLPTLMLAGPFSECWEPVRIALDIVDPKNWTIG